MRPLLVLSLHQLPADLADLVQGHEQVRVKHFVTTGPVEAFDDGVLLRLSRLVVALFPSHQHMKTSPSRSGLVSQRMAL
jgi:hypothetical protein